MNFTITRLGTRRLFYSAIFCISLAFVAAAFVAFVRDARDEYTILEEAAIASEREYPNTDNSKGAKFHNFTEVYVKYFAPIRHKKIKFLEIGLFQGLSAKMWELYFSKAELHFIDINQKLVKYNSTRSKYHFFNQSDETRLLQFASEHGPFDVIIDDGGHSSYQVIASFRTLFPFLNAGGIYVVEDFFTGYWSVYGGTGSVAHLGAKLLRVDQPGDKEGSSVRFFKNLIDEVNFGSAHTGIAASVPLDEKLFAKMSIYAERIKSIHFYNGMCVVLRK